MPEKTLRFAAQIQRQTQQFVGAFHELGVFNQRHAQIDFRKIVKGDGFLNRESASGPVTGAAAAFTSSLMLPPVLLPVSFLCGYTAP